MFVLRLKRRHRNGSNECFDKGLGLVSPLQHEMLADVAVGSFTSLPVRAKIDVCPLLPQERPKMVRRGERNNATPGHPGSPLIGLHRL
jgi:hypothetical protein